MTAEQPLRADRKRILVVANETRPDPTLCARVRERAGENGEVLVVAPALNSRLHHYLSDEDQARLQAQERLTRSAENLSGLGLNPSGASETPTRCSRSRTPLWTSRISRRPFRCHAIPD